MSTTVIFAELLIVGLQAMIWLAMLLLSIFGIDWFYATNVIDLRPWVQMVIVFVLAIAYSIGIFIDRVADSIFSGYDKQFRKKYLGDDLPSVPKMRLYIMSQNATVNKYIDYIRSRARIARSTAFNLYFMTVTFLLLYVTRLSGMVPFSLVVIICIVLLSAALVSIFAWRRISKTYYKRLKKGYEILKQKEKKKADFEEAFTETVLDEADDTKSLRKMKMASSDSNE